MRPLRLDLAGFTVFRDPTTVDFTDADFFALVGPTGAGKSTVLDAICFALYGTVPRWNDRRAVASALAPSAAEARVRLVFESAGARYVATRVVRRDAKGRVATTHAGLELLPRGFDLSTLDGGSAGAAVGQATELGEPLAGTPGELDAAVLEVVGLPYEQFTTCVLLPQGEFAEFLHAKPAQRQQILVSLLGLSVYERVRERATALATERETQMTATDRLLADLSDASDEALDGASRRAEAVRELAREVDRAVPELVRLDRQAAEARGALGGLDAELATLRRVTPPRDAAQVAEQARVAQEATGTASDAVAQAEEREEKLRGELATAGDPAALRRLLDRYTERDRLAGQVSELGSMAATAVAEHAAASNALRAATGAAQVAAATVAGARLRVEAARTAEAAAALRPHLRTGQPCPVCEQTVPELPAAGPPRALAAAEAELAAATRQAQAADRVVTERDRAARELDRTLAAVSAQREQLDRRVAELSEQLAEAPVPSAVRADLEAIEALRRGLDEASNAVRTARERYRRAATQAQRAEQRERAAWRDFDAARDAVATAGPPAAERTDLAQAWQALSAWALSEVERRRVRREELVTAAEAAAEASTVARQRVAELFAEANLRPPAPPLDGGMADPAGLARAAAVAVERAEAAHARLVERRAQADTLRTQRAGYEREAQVARALASHLRANNFERWLLEEALGLLVEGASRILRELTAGQYELGHNKGELFVVDHHDAALRRPVRTLSGGETFQASLALALALSEQLAGMAAGAASLESILLDEGFGSLDASTLDTVAATLENLAARGDRMVGVVTHVPALAERIPVRFEVRKDARTARVQRVDP
jgi:DNA repair protein SbcC/Rad50